MTVLGLMIGIVGTDLETGAQRFTFGMTHLYDGIEMIALALGLFGIAEFMNSVNQVASSQHQICQCALARHAADQSRVQTVDCRPMFRGTAIGSLCALIPGTGPTIASFVAYATEKKISKTRRSSAPA